jgi:hypothetical protein
MSVLGEVSFSGDDKNVKVVGDKVADLVEVEGNERGLNVGG